MPVIGEGNGGQGHAMSSVGESADALADHVDHPVLGLAHLGHGVEGHGGRPHDVAPGLIVLGRHYGDAGAVDQRTHQGFRDVVGGIVIFSGEILFHQVGHDVEDAGDHLVAGDGVGEFRVEDGEAREIRRAEDLPELEFLRVVGDDRAAVHLAAGPDHGQDAADGNEPAGRVLLAEVVLVPGVGLAPGGGSHALGIVHDGAAADGQDEVHVVLAGDPGAFIQFFHRRVRHDAGILEDLLAGVVQDLDDLVIDAVPFDGAAAVAEHDAGAVLDQFRGQEFQGSLAEDQFGRVVVGKVSEHDNQR